MTWTCMIMRTSGYVTLAVSMYKDGTAYRHMFPLLTLLALLLFHLLPSFLNLVLLAFFPSFYADHYLAISVSTSAAECFTFYKIRQVMLWNLLVDSSTRPSIPHQVRNFAKENIYFCTAWFMHSADPMPLLSVLGALFANLASNPAICSSPLWPKQSVTLSPAPLAAAKTLSVVLLEAAQPAYHARDISRCPCPIVLATWQVTGSMLALLIISVADIVRRRAFLRLPSVQARLRPHHAVALDWPWGGMSLPSRCIASVLGLFFAHVVLFAFIFDAMLDGGG